MTWAWTRNFGSYGKDLLSVTRTVSCGGISIAFHWRFPSGTLLTDVECGRAMQTRCPENCETGAGEGSTGIHGEQTGVHASWPGCGGCYCTAGRTGWPRGVAETLASNRTGTDTPTPPGTHRYGAPAPMPTPPLRNYGNGNLAAAPASRNAGMIVYLGIMSAWWVTVVEMRKGTCMRVMLPCPGLVLTSRSICWGIVLLV